MNKTTDYVRDLTESFSVIDTLKDTPNLFRESAITTLENAMKQPRLGSAYSVLKNGRDALANITDRSIADNYKVIYSQMCVLAVSSFEAILKKYFENAANVKSNLKLDNKKLSQMKITIEEVINNDLRFGGKLGKLILEKDNVSFQDLKSIKHTFETYFGKKVSLTEIEEKTACFYLEARHALVHKNGIADTKFIDAITNFDANLKNIKIGDRIVINQQDWALMKETFLKIVENLTTPPNIKKKTTNKELKQG